MRDQHWGRRGEEVKAGGKRGEVKPVVHVGGEKEFVTGQLDSLINTDHYIHTVTIKLKDKSSSPYVLTWQCGCYLNALNC